MCRVLLLPPEPSLSDNTLHAQPEMLLLPVLVLLSASRLSVSGAHFAKLQVSRGVNGGTRDQMSIPDAATGRLGGVGVMSRRLQVGPVMPALSEVRMGDRLELECEAFGSPPPVIQWLHDGQPISQGDEGKSLNNLLTAPGADGAGDPLSNLVPLEAPPLSGMAKVTSRLVIDCALPVHRGVYSCAAVSATDSDVSPSATVYVEADGVRNLSALLSSCQSSRGLGLLGLGVTPRPPRITSFFSFMMDVSGSDLTLPCAAEGSPRPRIFWRDNKDQVVAARRSRFKVLPNGSLMIFKVRWSDMGIFTCEVQSDVGRDNATTFVYPLSPEKCEYG